ncbi:MAG TPA: stage II sporulation protein R [Clostridiaceae bacterium]|nr:stage II sporulation protein R [Clostridiaceae bacterium]
MSKVLFRIKELGKFPKNNTILKSGLVIIMSALIMTIIYMNSFSEQINKGLAENLIRFHVIANSDSEEDQQLKRSVRDRVIEYMKVQLKDSGSLEHTKHIISNNLSNIVSIAEEAIADAGKNYKVKAELGSYPFPTKAYGDIVLPAGNYQALRVVIGKGEGANWWCVLFPPLCFVDATHGTVPDSVKEDLKEQLSVEEYILVTSSESEKDVPVKIKFKIVEIIQNSKNKFSAALNKLFNIKE